jgi:mannose-1-phosphate guanylyltransferase
MLEHTLRRAERLIPPARLLVVATASHQQHVFSCLESRPPGTVLLQPAGRDTCPGILLPLVHILHRDPSALVAIFPSDHFIQPGRRFMGAVARAAEYLTDHDAESSVLLGVEPTDAESDYGWIEPGVSITRSTRGRSSINRINRFIEKPSRERADTLMAEGCLWNTMVLVARAASLSKLVRAVAPEQTAYFSMVRAAIGTICESEVLNQVYQMMPSMNFSSAILARCPEKLLVLPVRKVLWSDWGRADRILATLTQLRIQSPALVREGACFKTTASTAGML